MSDSLSADKKNHQLYPVATWYSANFRLLSIKRSICSNSQITPTQQIYDIFIHLQHFYNILKLNTSKHQIYHTNPIFRQYQETKSIKSHILYPTANRVIDFLWGDSHTNSFEIMTLTVAPFYKGDVHTS